MTAAGENPFEQLLDKRIEELRGEGWSVLRQPDPQDLPEPLSRNLVRVDFVARRGDEILFGEVASRADARRERIDALAEQVAAVPGARLEVYWAGSTPAGSPDPDHVRRYIREADTIAGTSPQAALLMAFAALEGAVAIFSAVAGIRPGRTPWQTLSNLYSLGYVSEPDFNILRRLYELRSSIAHAASPRIPQLEDIRFCLDLASRMLEGRYVTADRLVEWFSRQYKSRQEPAAGDSMGRNEIVAILSAAFPYAANAVVSEAADWLRVAGADEQSPALADRAAAYASLDDPYAVALLLSALQEAGANEQAAMLLARDPAAHASLIDVDGVASLLSALQEAGAQSQLTELAVRAAASARLDDAGAVASLLSALQEAGANEQAAMLLARDPAAHASLIDVDGVASLLSALQEAGAQSQLTELAVRAAASARLADAGAVASLLSALQEAGANEQAAILLARDPAAHARFDDPRAIASLLDELREAGANEQAASLTARAAESPGHSLIEEGTERRYLRTDLTARGLAAELSFEWRGVRPPEGRHWRYTKEKLDQMYADGRIEFRRNGLPVGKRYLDEQSGTPAKS